MQQPVLDFEPAPSSFFRSIWHWILLGIACFLALFTFIPSWALVINFFIKIAWVVFVFWEFGRGVTAEEDKINPNPSGCLLSFWAIAGGTIVLLFCSFITNDHCYYQQTFETPTADVYIYSRSEGGYIDPPMYVLKRQNYPYPFMETFPNRIGDDFAPIGLEDSVIVINNRPIYDLRTHQILVNQ